MSNGFRKLSDRISIDDAGTQTTILVNGQWTFVLPQDIKYDTDCEYDDGREGGIDINGSTKAMVLKGMKNASKYAFNVALNEHLDLFGNYYTVIDCKYDNRFDDTDTSSQIIILDSDEIYVDLISVNYWPFGNDVEIRIRGENIDAYNFSMMVKWITDDEWSRMKELFMDIANSIRPFASLPKAEAGGKRKGITKVYHPDYIIEGTILRKYIGSEADIVIPDGVTEIPDNTFSEKSIRSVFVPEGVQIIGRRAFENCFKLEEVSLPSSLKELGGYAFVDCHKLKQINLGSKLTSIEDSVFSECYDLDNVVIPKKVKYIDAYAFKNCRNFTSIVLPESVEAIGFCAFGYCKNLSYLYIPASVNVINGIGGDTPFEGCDMLTIYCPKNSFVWEYAGSHNISRVAVDKPIEVKEPNRNATVKFAADKMDHTSGHAAKKTQASSAQSPPKKAKAVSLDASITSSSSKVTQKITQPAALGADFLECELVPANYLNIAKGKLVRYFGKEKHIMLPNGIKRIGDSAFSYNDKLCSIIMPDGVKSIEKCAFNRCVMLINVAIPKSVTNIGDSAFDGCKSLSSIIIPDSVTSVGNKAFAECKSLSSIIIPSSMTSIGNWVFTNCINLNSIIIPDSVSSIGEGAFSKCKKLSNISIPDGVTDILEYTFFECSKLTSIFLPNNVTCIGKGAFFNCTALREVRLPRSLEKIGENAFSFLAKNCVFQVSEGSYAEEYVKENSLKYEVVPE